MTEDHDRGLAFDLPNLLNRRRMLTLMAGAGLATLVGCGSDGDKSASGTTTSAPSGSATTSTPATTAADTTCEVIPQETGGPFPGDGSNGPNVLDDSGVVRSDIRSSFGSARGVAGGVPLIINLTVLNTGAGCAPYRGAAVYLWQCDRDGLYSMYSSGAQNENYLRGVQTAGSDGRVRFESIFPGAYGSRWPHIHFEVFPNVNAAMTSSGKLATSQLALPKDACDVVYATEGYEQSVANLSRGSLQSDMVFRDSYQQQLATVTGSVASGYTAELTVPV